MNSRINELILFLNRKEQTKINDIGYRYMSSIKNIDNKILREMAYPHNSFIIKFEIEPTRNLYYDMEFKTKKEYFTVRDVMNKIINFYNKEFSDYEKKILKHWGEKHNIHKLKNLNGQRSLYLFSNVFKGLKKVGDHTFEINFIDS